MCGWYYSHYLTGGLHALTHSLSCYQLSPQHTSCPSQWNKDLKGLCTQGKHPINTKAVLHNRWAPNIFTGPYYFPQRVHLQTFWNCSSPPHPQLFSLSPTRLNLSLSWCAGLVPTFIPPAVYPASPPFIHYWRHAEHTELIFKARPRNNWWSSGYQQTFFIIKWLLSLFSRQEHGELPGEYGVFEITV